jgi:hypothetical protein
VSANNKLSWQKGTGLWMVHLIQVIIYKGHPKVKRILVVSSPMIMNILNNIVKLLKILL